MGFVLGFCWLICESHWSLLQLLGPGLCKRLMHIDAQMLQQNPPNLQGIDCVFLCATIKTLESWNVLKMLVINPSHSWALKTSRSVWASHSCREFPGALESWWFPGTVKALGPAGHSLLIRSQSPENQQMPNAWRIVWTPTVEAPNCVHIIRIKMCVCMYVCTYVCMYVCMYIYICVHNCTYIHANKIYR